MIHIIENFFSFSTTGDSLPVIYNPLRWRCSFADTQRVVYGDSKSAALNAALAFLQHEYCILTDLKLLDAEYTSAKVLTYYNKYADADSIIFQQAAPQGAPQLIYFQFEKELELNDLQFISNCMISFKSTPVTNRGIRFDENFGPGTQFLHYEDKVFLADMISAGLKVMYIPDTSICKTGTLVFKSADYLRMLKSLGSALLRIYGLAYIHEYIAHSIDKLEKIETERMKTQEVPLYRIETLLQGAFAYYRYCLATAEN